MHRVLLCKQTYPILLLMITLYILLDGEQAHHATLSGPEKVKAIRAMMGLWRKLNPACKVECRIERHWWV